MKLKAEFKERSRELLGSEAKDYFKILEEPLTDSFRVNTLKADPTALIKRLKNQGWVLRKVPWAAEAYWVDSGPNKLGNSLEHFLGYIYVQEPASMIPPLLMELTPGLKVLDMAASPGSKTSQIAALMSDEGLIIANDVRIDRVSILKINMQRMGVRSLIISRRNGANFGRMTGFFDRILLDAPCSGEGVIRKNPYVAEQWSPQSFKKFNNLQMNLIQNAYKALKRDGVMIYSTCSLAPEENELVVNHLLEKTNAVLEPVKLKGLKTRPGVTEWHGQVMDESISQCARIYPQDNDTEGFFVAKIRKGVKK